MKSIQARIIRFFLLIYGSSAVFSLAPQKIIYPGDWIYDALTTLAMEQGVVLLDTSTLTVMQINLMLDRINTDALSESGLILYDRLRAALGEPGALSLSYHILQFDFDPGLQPELYFKTNEDLGWVYDRNDRKPFFPFGVAFSLSSYLTIESDLYFGENRRLSEAHDNYFNFMYDKMIDRVQNIDTNLPKRAYLSAGIPLGKGMGINFRLGIGDDFIARTHTGSIVFSDNIKDLSYANLTIYTPYLKYTADVMEMEVTKYWYLHRINVNVFDRLSFSMVEGVMINAPFEIRFLNPLMIFHGLTSWLTYGDYNDQLGNEDAWPRIGSFLALVFDGRFWKYGRLYGMVAMNQLEVPSERGPESTVPDAFAFQGGYESYLPFRRGYVHFGLEGVYTFPFMYILEKPGWSYFRESREVSNPPIREWTGTPFGPDSIAGTFWVGYQAPDPWSVSLSFLFAVQGENASLNVYNTAAKSFPRHPFPSTHEESLAVTPTGTPKYSYTVTLTGTWSPLDWIHLSLQPAYKIVNNYNHIVGRLEHGFEVILSAQIVPRIYPRKSR
ncbi:MAG: hypothetical protein LBQ46_13545 [Treponema sp.]|jgi:hypothetical protein|nr:hypothetical protein [Treponema sp.]